MLSSKKLVNSLKLPKERLEPVISQIIMYTSQMVGVFILRSLKLD